MPQDGTSKIITLKYGLLCSPLNRKVFRWLTDSQFYTLYKVTQKFTEWNFFLPKFRKTSGSPCTTYVNYSGFYGDVYIHYFLIMMQALGLATTFNHRARIFGKVCHRVKSPIIYHGHVLYVLKPHAPAPLESFGTYDLLQKTLPNFRTFPKKLCLTQGPGVVSAPAVRPRPTRTLGRPKSRAGTQYLEWKRINA